MEDLPLLEPFVDLLLLPLVADELSDDVDTLVAFVVVYFDTLEEFDLLALTDFDSFEYVVFVGSDMIDLGGEDDLDTLEDESPVSFTFNFDFFIFLVRACCCTLLSNVCFLFWKSLLLLDSDCIIRSYVSSRPVVR